MRPLLHRLLLGGTAFDPRLVPGLKLWLDSNDYATYTFATGVSQHRDKSGSGNHAAQATGANQPTYVAGVKNGRSVLRSEGPELTVDKHLALGAGSLGMFRNVGGATIFQVFSPADATNTGYLRSFSAQTPADANRVALYWRSSVLEAGGRRLDADSYAFVQSSNSVVDGVWYLAEVVFDFVNATLSVTLNGVTTSGAFHTAGNTEDTDSLHIDVMASSDTFNGAPGDYGELLVYARALSLAERMYVRNGLRSHRRWGLTW
jgi:hypothetical protein